MGMSTQTIYLVLLDSQYELVVYHNICKSTLLNYCHHLMILWSTWYISEYCIPKGIPQKNNSHPVNVNLVLSFHICHTCGELSHDFWTPWGFVPSPRKTQWMHTLGTVNQPPPNSRLRHLLILGQNYTHFHLGWKSTLAMRGFLMLVRRTGGDL